MGANESKSTVFQSMQQEMTCTDDLMCQNIDSKRSVPGQDLVLVCPNATCQAGRCACGASCERDPYTGMCCKGLEKRVVQTSQGQHKTTFCLESDPSNDDASSKVPKGLLESFSGFDRDSFGAWN